MTVAFRHLALLTRIALATFWALLLCLGGLGLIFDWAAKFPAAAWDCRLAGVTLLCFGQFVFIAVVADRLWPRASPRVTWPVHLTLGLFALLGLGILLAGMIGRA
jgi:hypothetical protein